MTSPAGPAPVRSGLLAADQVRLSFARRFGGPPEVITSAPARVNLIGEHLDYNGGEVLPMAIAQRTFVAARRRSGASTHVASASESGRGTFDAAAPERSGAWWDYVAGTAVELSLTGTRPPAAEIMVSSDVPEGAGLSSSAALEVASALALLTLGGSTRSARDIALVAWRAEVEFVGVPCGIMDQFAVSLGRAGEAVHVWCDTGAVAYVPVPEPVLIFDTAVPRSLRVSRAKGGHGAFDARRAECEQALALLRREYPDLPNLAAVEPDQVAAARLPPPFDRRARHVSTEMRRVRAAVAALEAGTPLPGDVLLASHRSLREDFECSTVELDWFVDLAMAVTGIRGARLTGAGWGGCAIAVGDEGALVDAAPRLVAQYERRFDRRPRAWISRAADGARIE